MIAGVGFGGVGGVRREFGKFGLGRLSFSY